MLKHWNFLLFLFVATSPASGADGPADPSGIWRWVQEFGDTSLNSMLRLEQVGLDGEKPNYARVFGVYSNGDEEFEIEAGSIHGNKLSLFVATDDFKLEFSGIVAGDTIRGEVVYRFGESSIERPWLADRGRVLEDFLGVWQLRISSDGNVVAQPKLVITLLDDEVVGRYLTETGETLPLEDLRVEDDDLMFALATERRGQRFTAQYEASMREEELVGTIHLRAGQLSGQREFAARLIDR